MTIAPDADGTTVISGVVADQSALHALLRKLSDLGVPLVSVMRARSDDAEAPASATATHLTRRSTT